MGCRLGATLPTILWIGLKIFFTKLKRLGVILYKRYVDDTFVILKLIESATQWLNFLNTLHPNIKFTTEKEKDG